MSLVIEWSEGSILLQDGDSAVVGRSKTADVFLDHSKVSRHHLTIWLEGGTWRFKDLGSSNGTLIRGKATTEGLIENGLQLSVGGEAGVPVTFTLVETTNSKQKRIPSPETGLASETGFYSSPLAFQESKKSAIATRLALGPRLRIGREDTCDLRLEDLLVSKRHAEIILKSDGTHEIVDLDSSNGTYVNGENVRRRGLLIGDKITLGSCAFVYAGSALEPIDEIGGLGLGVENVNYEVDGRLLLDSVSFQLKPSSLTAILGPSGAGKSTLLAAITGKLPIKSGSVTFGDKDLRASYRELRHRIGFVPQSDLLHTNLTTRQALTYGAKLRFPQGTSELEISHRVEEVIDELELTNKADLRIDKLSGGQRKRASVALELLTQPVLLFLDEPTSGLDPGLDRQVMKLLKKLAQQGKTVVVVTHSTANLDLADDLVLMAPGGKLAFFGSPQSALSAFKKKDWAEVFEMLLEGVQKTPEELRRKPEKYSTRNLGGKVDDLDNPPLQGWIRQVSVLTQRYIKVISADVGYLVFLAILPFLMAAVGVLVGSEYGLGEGPSRLGDLNPSARSLIFVIVLGSVFIGASASIQELIKERVIFAREQSVGLSTSAYIASKVVVLTFLVIIQSTIFTVITLSGRPLPSQGVVLDNALAELTLTVGFLTVSSMLLGLLVSSLVKSRETTMPILVSITMFQIVLSGAVPLSVDWILGSISNVAPAFWATNLIASTVDLNSISFAEKSDFIDFWVNTQANWSTATLVLAFMSIVLAIATWLITDRVRATR